ncbi:Eps15-like protein pan1p [Microthyrium microscopicum]|uniref:Endocytosis protein 3 n=1 Tax=Microthyrium microscopicum TaxID=703497 RepID=A0A6A6U8D7_9PEZI|nr:Eps15-like protein pan1p [Microthyrium microscopicum]
MANKRIEQAEIEKYWEVFSNYSGGNQYITGIQAAPVFKNSGLTDKQLERIWDLADVDNDGNLDFEEFIVAMRLIYDLVNGEYRDVPQTLPDWLVPESKSHLVQANRALTGRQPQFESVDDDDDVSGLKDGFDWYMSPTNRTKYEEIYTSHRSPHGEISFTALQPLYDSLDVPDTDVRSAWNLINPSASPTIGKDATLAFLHILNNRHEGFRIPRNVPASLRASFEKNSIEYNIDRVQSPADRWGSKGDESTSTGRKAKFGEAYSSRLGNSGYKTRGTDFSGVQKDAEWEHAQLKRQLRDMEEKIERSEKEVGKRKNGRRENKSALVKRELELLLDYKRKELRDLENGEGKYSGGASLSGLAEDIETIKEQVDGLETHLRERERVLDDLKRQIAEEKAR